MAASVEELTAINEIGPEIAQSILQFFHEPKNKAVMEKFSKAGVEPQKKLPWQMLCCRANHLFSLE